MSPRRSLVAALFAGLGPLRLAAPLGAVGALGGCSTGGWPTGINAEPSSSARDRLAESAQAQGLAGWRALRDVNLGWQDEADFATLQQRWLPAAGRWRHDRRERTGTHALLRRGPAGGATETLAAWRDGQPAADTALRSTVALEADLWRLALLGAMAWTEAPSALATATWGEPLPLDDQLCDRVLLRLPPGVAGGGESLLVLWIDRGQGLTRRLRWQSRDDSAGVELDLQAHAAHHGVYWPTTVVERRSGGLMPARIRRWRLTGLDVSRGYPAEALDGAVPNAAAAAPPAALR